jgi:hypothetical protein
MVRFIVEVGDEQIARDRYGCKWSFMFKIANGTYLHNIIHKEFFNEIWSKYKIPLKKLHHKLYYDGYNASYRFYEILTSLVLKEEEEEILNSTLSEEAKGGISLRTNLINKINAHKETFCEGQLLIDKYLFLCNLVNREQYKKCGLDIYSELLITGFDALTTASDESVLKAFFYIKLCGDNLSEDDKSSKPPEKFATIWNHITKTANDLFYVSFT